MAAGAGAGLMELQLAGRTALVTASSQGLGKAVAQSFAAEGAGVAICARDQQRLRQTAAEIESTASVFSKSVDLRRAGEVEALITDTVSKFGGLDILVVNCGGPPPGGFAQIDNSHWDEANNRTLMSAVNLVRGSLPHLEKSDCGSILFIASSSVKQPIPNLLLSNAYRGAVAGLAKTLANELAPRIRVNSLLPGRIRTSRTEELARSHMSANDDLEDILRHEAAAIPMQRFGTPEEFAKVAVFLSSPAASYVTGATWTVDGGLIRSTY